MGHEVDKDGQPTVLVKTTLVIEHVPGIDLHELLCTGIWEGDEEAMSTLCGEITNITIVPNKEEGS